jgi:hypothetical protein
MIPYIGKILMAFPKKIMGMMPSPTADHLFQIRPPHQIPISAGGPSPCVPPHHGPTSLSLKELSEHTNDGCFSKNQSETT